MNHQVFPAQKESALTTKSNQSAPNNSTHCTTDQRMTASLPYDIARCPGVPHEPGERPGWREGCETCLRRTAPGNPHRQVWMQPPPIIAFWCEYLIEPDGHETLRPETTTR